ncbi:hypothetical protein [Acinetobacter baumannii]|uniref:hypothetical protein n=1 Tax=Acinetobacter baumannii TaxID=470 RepID=UPI00028CE362|nr:hypothetical protein [Acinetobacter baumannii]EHU2349638.1 hypothetical protein [Acinetobacter baumannii]EHU2369955.1 hypothetical protein [Acinetobacter baumannii]EHU2572186.1 hypothetical protein [Acinetobacter baumannii]EKL41320.1 hypothetical protein ACIN5098_2663 [Acinetobacter baumannii OIFC098]KRR95705.1 ATP synthase F1 subunit delta [Acinetobacter baumannii]
MASASLGRLTLDLVAQIGQFVGPMTQAERKAKESTAKMGKAFSDFKEQMNASLGGTQIGSAIEGITGKLGALRGGVLTATASLAGMAVGGLVVAGGALSQMSLDLAKADAELNQLSRRAVTSAENFQIVAGAASAFGVEQDKLSDILADTSEKLGEYTSTKGGGAKDFFEMLANNTKMTSKEIDDFAKKLSTMDTTDALGLITTKLDEMGATAAEKRFVLESLASDLGDLAPLFANNSELIKEYGVQLHEAGVIRTQESIDKSLLLNAQTQALGTQFQGFKNQLASQMTPVLSNLIQYFVDGAVKSGSFGTVLSSVGAVAKIVGVAIVGVASAVSVVIQSISGFANLINHIGVVAARLDAATTISDQINVLKTGFSEGKDIWNDTAAGIDKTIRSAMAFVSNVQTSTMPTLTGLSAAQLKVNQANLANSKSTITDTDTAKENAKAKEEQAKAAAKAAKAQQDLNKMVGASALNGLRIKGAESIAGGQVRAYTANFAQLVQSALGKDLNRFTAFNDTYHKGTNSKHATGNAFDFTLGDVKKSGEAVTQLEQMAKRYGFIIKVLDEYRNPSSRATGGHIHVSVLGYKGTADALKDANAELDIVQKANDEALKIQEEREKKQLAIAVKYASPEQKLALDNAQAIKQIKLAHAGDQEAIDKYLKLQEESYQKDLDAFRAAQNEKIVGATQDAARAAANWNQTYADISGNSGVYGLQQTRNSRYDESFALFDSQSTVLDKQAEDPSADLQALAEQREAIWQEHSQRMLLIDQVYNRDKASMGLQAANETLSGMTDLMGSMLGEQSAAYKAMFAMSKAFAIAQALINAPQTFSNVYTSVSAIPLIGPYIAPAMAAAAVGLQVAQASQIKSVGLTGMAHDGIANVPKEGTWLLDGGERVLNPEQNKDFTSFIANQKQQRGSGVNININVPPGYMARERRLSNGDVTIDIVRQEVEQAFTRLGTQANSHESQMMQQGFMVERNRG